MKAPAKRLLFSDGSWKLEVENLVHLGANLYRPMPHYLEGPERVLEHLERHDKSQSSVLEARQLIDGWQGDDDAKVCFKLINGKWIEAEFTEPQAVNTDPEDNSVSGSATGNLGDIKRRLSRLENRPDHDTYKKQIAALTNAHERLFERVKQLEENLKQIRVEFATTGGSAKEEPAKPEVENTPPTEPKKVDKGDPLLKMPTQKVFEAAIRDLVAQEITLKKQGKPPKLGSQEVILFTTTLIDDENVPMGAIIADLEATVRLGGALVMLGKEAQEKELEAGNPSEDTVSSMSEVVNILSAVFNNIEGNPHLRTTPLIKLDVDTAEEWTLAPALEIVYESSLGGKVRILSRGTKQEVSS